MAAAGSARTVPVKQPGERSNLVRAVTAGRAARALLSGGPTMHFHTARSAFGEGESAQAASSPGLREGLARFPHPSARQDGPEFEVRLPIRTRPLYRSASAVVGARPVHSWFIRPSILTAGCLEALRRVGARLAQIHHLHLAPILGVARWHDVVIAWPRVRHSVAGLLATGLYDRKDAASLMAPIAEALSVAHERDLVHGYLDPAQIALQAVGPTVMGVGVWTCLDHRLVGTRFRRHRNESLAPEVFAGRRPEPSSDCYSVALIFARLLSGDRVLSATDARNLFDRAGLDVLSAALAPDPFDRPASMQAVALELNRLSRQQYRRPRRPAEGPARAPLSPSSVCVHGLTLAAVAAIAFYLASTL